MKVDYFVIYKKAHKKLGTVAHAFYPDTGCLSGEDGKFEASLGNLEISTALSQDKK